MLLIAVLSSVIATAIGIFVSFHTNASTSGCIVLAQALLFVLSLVIAPKYGMLARRRVRV
jgi:manganese transport system permease protein